MSATLIVCKLTGVDGLWLDHWTTGVVGLVLALCISRLSPELLSLRRSRHWQEAPHGSGPQGDWSRGGGWVSLALLALLLLGTVAALLAVNLVGTKALGAQRWLALGPFQVQPSEFAKLATIVLVAAILDRFPIQKPMDLLLPFGVILVPWALVLVQPDLGTSLVFGAVLLGMLYWSAMPWQWLLLLLSPLPTALLGGLRHTGLPGILVVQVIWIAAMGIMAWRHLPWRWSGAALTAVTLMATSLSTPWLWEHGLKDYQRDRLTLFLNPSMDPLGGGYHIIQSIIGIGSGGFVGTGLLQGQLTRLQFIPEQHTDFIFSALGEEMGFVGCFLVVSGFAAWCWRLLKIATVAKTDFESFLVIGILAMVMFQVVVNVFMTTGLGPVTGIPLPFMSYGRSALLMNCLGIGLVAAVERRGRQTRPFS
nr:FtsW/RodA/SpoVE family cell cycle protein [Candidatus Synechococcus spongiarum]